MSIPALFSAGPTGSISYLDQFTKITVPADCVLVMRAPVAPFTFEYPKPLFYPDSDDPPDFTTEPVDVHLSTFTYNAAPHNPLTLYTVFFRNGDGTFWVGFEEYQGNIDWVTIPYTYGGELADDLGLTVTARGQDYPENQDVTVPELDCTTSNNAVVRVIATVGGDFTILGSPFELTGTPIVAVQDSEDSVLPVLVPQRTNLFRTGTFDGGNTAIHTMVLTMSLYADEIGVLGTMLVDVEPFALGPATPQSLTVGSAVPGSFAPGPQLVTAEGMEPDMFVARLLDRSDMGAAGTVLTGTQRESFLDQQNDAGSGQITLDNDDAQLALIDDNSLIRFEIGGCAALTMIPRSRTRQTVAEQEEYDETTRLEGPGHLALLDEAVVYPSRGLDARPIEDERAFNWAAVPFDDSGWAWASPAGLQRDGLVNWTDDDGVPWPYNWPDGDAEWISPDGTTDTNEPGDNYFRNTFTTAGAVTIFAAADNLGDIWVDGQKVMELDTFTQTTSLFLDTSPGEHTIAAHIWNAPDDYPPGDNPTGLLVAVYPTNGATRLITSSSPILRSDDSWRMCAYPPYPPGMTPGEILIVLLDEARARDGSCLEGLTLMFDAEVDSAGTPWAETADYSARVGNDLLTVVKELADQYIDVWMAPGGLELYAWVKGGQGAATAVTFHEPTDDEDPESGNLAALTHKRVV